MNRDCANETCDNEEKGSFASEVDRGRTGCHCENEAYRCTDGRVYYSEESAGCCKQNVCRCEEGVRRCEEGEGTNTIVDND